MIEYPKANDFQKAKFVGTWKNTGIPIYDVPSMHALNQLVGYVKHINAGTGTVLYRGQCQLYESVVPSIKHDMSTFKCHQERLIDTIDAICDDDPLKKFFGLRNGDIEGWSLYENLVIEAVLQHYGAKTYCVDFVDNHWTALWFGLYRWDSEQKKYIIRTETQDYNDQPLIVKSADMLKKTYPQEPTIESVKLDRHKIDELKICASKGTVTFDELVKRNTRFRFENQYAKWKKQCSDIDRYNDYIKSIESAAHLYLFLYVADTNSSNIHGLYIGKNTYTIDLRKALPSTFLRPCSQHGWIVRGKETSYDFNSNIACVIQMNIELAKKMLGEGLLLSQENFFPNEKVDQGYNILLLRQQKSRLQSKFPKILPPNMIMDFH